jgi:hypothetical protein
MSPEFHIGEKSLVSNYCHHRALNGTKVKLSLYLTKHHTMKMHKGKVVPVLLTEHHAMKA